MSEKVAIKKSTLGAIGEAVRNKEGSTDLIPVNALADRIGALPTASGENKLAHLVDGTIIEITAEDLEGATKINNYTFNECKSLARIIIPNSVTSIGGYAFSYCESLASIIIPNSVTSIGEYAFQYCKSLTSVTLPNAIKKIPYYAFYRCSKLTNITIPNSVTNIERNAFCATGLTSITIPNSVTYFEGAVFDSATSLKEAYYEGDISSWLNISFSDLGSNPICHAHGLYIKNSSGEYELLENLEIPDSITELKAFALYGCESLKSVTIPNSVTRMGASVFRSCVNLTSITIPNSVTDTLGSQMFCDCEKLASVRIGNGITFLAGSTFQNCKALTDIYIDAPEGSIAHAPWSATNATVHWNTPLPSEEV